MSLAPKPIHVHRPSSWRSIRRQIRKQIQEASSDMLQMNVEESDLKSEVTSKKEGATDSAPAQRTLRRSLSSPVAGRKASRMLRLATTRPTDVYETVGKVASARQTVTSAVDEIDSNDKDPTATPKSRRRKQSAMTSRVSSRQKRATSIPTPRRSMSDVSRISSKSSSSGSSHTAASTRRRRNRKGRSRPSHGRSETSGNTPLTTVHKQQRRRSSADHKTLRRSGSQSKRNNLAKKRVDSAPSIPRKAPESLSSSSSSDESTRQYIAEDVVPSFDEPHPGRNSLQPPRSPSRSQSLIVTKKEAQDGHPMSYLRQTSRFLSSIAATPEVSINTHPHEMDKKKKDETINQQDQKTLWLAMGSKKGTGKQTKNNRKKTPVPSLDDVLRNGGSSSRSITERTGSTISTDQSSPSLENQSVLMSPLVTRLSPARDSLSSLFHDLKTCSAQPPILESERVLEKRKKDTTNSLYNEEEDEGASDIDSVRYDEDGDASVSSESPMMPNMGQAVTFGTVSIREYARTVGDNPSVSSGTPIGLDWTYYCTKQVHVDYYERKVRKRGPRTRRDFYLSAQSRFHLLLDEWGFSVQDISHATERASEIRHLRQVSIFGEGSPMAAQPAVDRWDAIPSMPGSMSL